MSKAEDVRQASISEFRSFFFLPFVDKDIAQKICSKRSK
jgi:hypothetical protein